MKTLKEFIDELYALYMKDVEEHFNDPGLYDRFSLKKLERYGKWFERYKDDPERLEHTQKRWFEEEKQYFEHESVAYKYYKFTKDENWVSLHDLAALMGGLARDKYHKKEITEEQIAQAKANLNEICRLYELVPDYYKSLARNLRSECTVEYNYIAGISPHYSLRLADYIRYQK